MPKPLPSADLLRAIFRYDRKTGRLFWRERADMDARWNARFAGRPAGSSGGGRVSVHLKGYKILRAHRIIWKMVYDEEPEEIDHRDGDPANNRLGNLRAATRLQNLRNRRTRPGASGLRGVKRAGRRWTARIVIGRRELCLGYYDDPRQAHRAWRRAAQVLFGEFAPRQ